MKLKQALLHNTGWRIITMLFSFLNNIIIVRLLGAAAGAEFFFALAVFTLISTVLRFGLENGIVYYSTKFPKQTGPIADFILLTTVVQIAACFALLHYFVPVSGKFTQGWCIAFITGNVLIYYATAFYQVKRMFISINLSATVFTFLQTLILASFYFSRSNAFLKFQLAENITDAVLMMLTGGLMLHLLFLFLFFYRSNRRDLSTLRPDRLVVSGLFKYSLVNFAATVLMFLVMRVDFYFVEKYCDSITFANYIQVAKIGQMALVFPGLIGGVVFPFTVNAEAAFAEKISFFCRLLTLAFLILFVGLLASGKYIFTWLLGPDYSLMFTGIACTFVGVYCLALNLIFVSYFEGRNRQKIILISALTTLLVIISGDYIFVPRYGYIAAAIIFSVANFGGMLILLWYFKRLTATSLKDIFLFKNADKFIFKFWKSPRPL